jgi:hypothetical protein
MTSIQRLMGHRRLNSTMIYARVHDRTVAEDYYAAMAQIEKSLDLAAWQSLVAGIGDTGVTTSAEERVQLLELLNRLAEPQLDIKVRMDLVKQIRCLLDRGMPGRLKVHQMEMTHSVSHHKHAKVMGGEYNRPDDGAGN